MLPLKAAALMPPPRPRPLPRGSATSLEGSSMAMNPEAPPSERATCSRSISGSRRGRLTIAVAA